MLQTLPAAAVASPTCVGAAGALTLWSTFHVLPRSTVPILGMLPLGFACIAENLSMILFSLMVTVFKIQTPPGGCKLGGTLLNELYPGGRCL